MARWRSEQLVVVNFRLELGEHIVGHLSALLGTLHELLLSQGRSKSIFSDAGEISCAHFTMFKTKNTALLSESRTSAPAYVVHTSLSIATFIIAHETFLLFAWRTDHRVSVWTSIVVLGTHHASVAHTSRAVLCAQAATLAVVTFRAFWVPKKAKLLAVFAHFL